jgi:hypothetical protein
LLAAAFPLSRGPAVKRKAAGSKEEGEKNAGKTFYSTELLVWVWKREKITTGKVARTDCDRYECQFF